MQGTCKIVVKSTFTGTFTWFYFDKEVGLGAKLV